MMKPKQNNIILTIIFLLITVGTLLPQQKMRFDTSGYSKTIPYKFLRFKVGDCFDYTHSDFEPKSIAGLFIEKDTLYIGDGSRNSLIKLDIVTGKILRCARNLVKDKFLENTFVFGEIVVMQYYRGEFYFYDKNFNYLAWIDCSQEGGGLGRIGTIDKDFFVYSKENYDTLYSYTIGSNMKLIRLTKTPFKKKSTPETVHSKTYKSWVVSDKLYLTIPKGKYLLEHEAIRWGWIWEPTYTKPGIWTSECLDFSDKYIVLACITNKNVGIIVYKI